MKRFLTLLLAVFMFTGCDGFANKDNIMNLLSSPKLSQRENRIVSCIKDYLGQDVILKYPKQGSNISPVQTVDLSGDGSDEAVVLYTAPGMGGTVRLAVLSGQDNIWQVEYEGEGLGSEIHSISFTDLTPSADRQIVVGYTYSDSSEKFLSVYFTDDGKVSDIQHQTCQDYLVADVTGDGIQDIILAGVNADNQYTQLKLLSASENGVLTSLVTRQLKVPNARVTSIALSKNDFSDKMAIVVDYTDSYFRVYTQGMYFSDYKLNEILSPDQVQKRWVYDYSLDSRDVDADGYLETPTVIDSGNTMPENMKFMEWTSYLAQQPVRKYYGFCEASSGIYFRLPELWQNYVVMTYGENENIWLLKQTTENKTIVTFELLSTGYDEDLADNEIIVGTGTLQIKITFDDSVSADQRQYITEGLMYIK
ncbi:MAG: hypothetical protein IJN77_01000 [Oscillospiraceae bacterium]|nr:hypothetical protein [Oscillospiraceae bacterium]MBR6608904.1 hypothetical protein [Oscillospiraceae bacterium]